MIRALGLTFALALGACTPSHPSARAPAARPSAPASALDYVPAAGLRWLAFARPAKIAADPGLSEAFAGVLPKPRLDAYAASTGVDLRKVPAGLVAGYDLGFLSVAELPSADVALVRERFASRLTDGGITKRVRPDIYRISGTERDRPLSLVSIENRLVAVASPDLTLTRVVEAYAEHRIKSPTALHGAALSTLPAPSSDVLFAFYAPGPFTEESFAAGTPTILRAALALGVMVRKGSNGSLAMSATLSGDWSAQPGAGDELRRVWGQLASSSTGRLLGLDLARALDVQSESESVTLSLELPLAPLIQGLRALTSANVPEIFDIIPEPPAAPPPPN